MRILVLAALIISNALISFSQDENQTTKEETATKSIKKSDHLAIDLTLDNWLDIPDSIDIDVLSRGVSISILHEWRFGRSNFGLALGGAIAANNIFHDTDIVEDSLSVSYFSPIDKNRKYKINKLVTAYLDIPIELRFRNKPDKNGNSLKVYGGFKIGYLLNSHTKYKGDDQFFASGDKVKIKTHDIHNIDDIRYGIFARIGYGPLALTGYYSLTPLFDGKGPQVVPFSIGIAILTM